MALRLDGIADVAKDVTIACTIFHRHRTNNHEVELMSDEFRRAYLSSEGARMFQKLLPLAVYSNVSH